VACSALALPLTVEPGPPEARPFRAGVRLTAREAVDVVGFVAVPIFEGLTCGLTVGVDCFPGRLRDA
jgi:hypothetical protein